MELGIVEIILIFIEMMITLLLYNSLFNKGRKDKLLAYCIVIAVCSTLFYIFNSKYGIFTYIVLLLVEIIVVSYIDNKNINLTLMQMFISVIATFIIQGSIIAIVYILTAKTKEYKYIHLAIYSIVSSILIIIINHNKKLENIDLEKYLEEKIFVSNIIFNALIFFMILKIIYDSGKMTGEIIIQINLLIFISIIFSITSYRNLHNTIIKNKEMEVKNTYNPLLEEIIDNMKCNEHEYKNHIGMIYSMIQVSESVPELKEKTKKYIGSIEDVNVLSNVLDVESTIVKAVLYSKLVECNKWGIVLDYKMESNLEESVLKDTEINITLNNLLNNAIEATKNSEQKHISIDIRKLEKYRIEIKNNISGLNIDASKIQDFFKKGFSSKGKGRGYGLHNVQKIVKKYKGSIYARVIEDYLVIEIYI